MKRILLTLTVLFVTLTSFGQLNLDGFSGNRWHETLEGALKIIIETNGNVDVNNIKKFDYEFEDGRMFYFYIFTNNEGDFLDIIFFNKESNKRYELNDNRKFFWNRERYVIHYPNANNKDVYKFIMNDNSFIIIEFEPTKYRKERSGGKDYCTKTYYEIYVIDRIDSIKHISRGYNYKSEYVDCK